LDIGMRQSSSGGHLINRKISGMRNQERFRQGTSANDQTLPFPPNRHGESEKIGVGGDLKVGPGQIRPGAGREALPEIGRTRASGELLRGGRIAAQQGFNVIGAGDVLGNGVSNCVAALPPAESFLPADYKHEFCRQGRVFQGLRTDQPYFMSRGW